MKNLREQKYIALMAIVVLFMAIIGLVSFGQIDEYKGKVKVASAKITAVDSKYKASINDLSGDNAITSQGYDEINYTVSYTITSSEALTRDVVVKATLPTDEKYSSFKAINSNNITSTLSSDRKEIELHISGVTTNENHTATVKMLIEGAPNGYKVTPSIQIKEETDENFTSVTVNEVEVKTNSLTGTVKDTDGMAVSGIELIIKKNNTEVKSTYTDDDGKYVFSGVEEGAYTVEVDEEVYEKVSQSNVNIKDSSSLDITVKAVTPYQIHTDKFITSVTITNNGKTQKYTYGQIRRVQQAVKNLKEMTGEVEYKIVVSNKGTKEGMITVVKDELPEGFSFDAKKNGGWEEKNGVLYNRSLEGITLKGGESREEKLILDIIKTNEAKTYINKVTAKGEIYEKVVYILDGQKYKELDVLEGETIKEEVINNENFSGWYIDKNYTNKYNFKNPVRKDLILYGKTVVPVTKYKVTFNDKNPETGEVTKWDEQEVKEGDPAEEPETNPEHTGYTFKCWEDEEHNVWDFATPITSTLVLTSCYDKNTYNVRFYDYSNNLVKTIPVKYKETVNTAEIPVLPEVGHTFKGWYELTKVVSFDFTTLITRDIDLYPKHDINQNDVTFDDEGRITTVPVDYGATVDPIDSLGKQGHTFSHWSLERNNETPFNFSTPIIEPTTLYAVYHINTYNVTFIDRNPATSVETQWGEVQHVTYGGLATAPETNPTTAGYTFNNWQDATGHVWDFANDTVTSDVTLYSSYTINKYTVTYMDDGNLYAKQENIPYNTKTTAPSPAPTKENKSFVGWSLDVDADPIVDFNFEETTITDNITLYSHYVDILPPDVSHTPTEWTRNSVTVTIGKEGHPEYSFKYKIDTGAYQDYVGPFTVDENCTIVAKSVVGTQESVTTTHPITNIDKIPPVISSFTDTGLSTTGFTVNVTAGDGQSGLKYIRLYKDDVLETTITFNEYELREGTGTHDFTDLEPQTTYRIKAIAVDAVGNESEAVEKEIRTEYRIVARIIGRENSLYEDEEMYENFPSLDSAVKACPTGQCTIQMVLSTNESVEVLEGQDITLDINGKTITGVIDGYTLKNSGDFQIVDWAETPGSIVNANGIALYNEVSGILTLGELEEPLVVSTTVPYINGGTTGVYNASIDRDHEGQFRFYDGKIAGTVAIDGRVTDTPYLYNANAAATENNRQVATLTQLAEAEARLRGVYYTKLQQAIDDAENGYHVEGTTDTDLLRGFKRVSSANYGFNYDEDTNALVSANATKGSTAQAYTIIDLTEYENDQKLLITGQVLGNNGSYTSNVEIREEDANGDLIEYVSNNAYSANTTFSFSTADEPKPVEYILEKGKRYYVKLTNTITGTSDSDETSDIKTVISNMTLNDYTLENLSINPETDIKKSEVMQYGFEYDSETKTIKSNNQYVTATAFSYIEVDLTEATEDRELIVNASIDSMYSSHYGMIEVKENNSISYDNNSSAMAQMYVYYNSSYPNEHFSGIRNFTKTLTKGKKYYVQFYYLKNYSSGYTREQYEEVGCKDQFIINSIDLVPVQKVDGNLNLYTDLVTPGTYGWSKSSESSSYAQNNNNSYNNTEQNTSIAHSYIPIDLTNVTTPKTLKCKLNASQTNFYATVTNSTDMPDVSNSGTFVDANKGYISSSNYYYANLTPGQINYVHFVYNRNDSSGYTIYLYDLELMDGHNYDLSKELKTNNKGFTEINTSYNSYYPGSTMQGATYDSYVKVDLTNATTDQVVTVNAELYSGSNFRYMYISTNPKDIGATTILNDRSKGILGYNSNKESTYYVNGSSIYYDYHDFKYVLHKGNVYYVHFGLYGSGSSSYDYSYLRSVMTYPVTSHDINIGTLSHVNGTVGKTPDYVEDDGTEDKNFRYIGKNPNNYVKFNNETWRIIGIFDTKDENNNTDKRIKLIRNDSIGSGYAWDSTPYVSNGPSINSGNGINEWSQADLMKLLNPGYDTNQEETFYYSSNSYASNGNQTVNNSLYWNKASGTCITGPYNTTKSCDFTSIGLDATSRSMIDTVVWNTGAIPYDTSSVTGLSLYTAERGNNTTKSAEYTTSGVDDEVTRTTTWTGKVGLPYMSDYILASGDFYSNGNLAYTREQCISSTSYPACTTTSTSSGSAWMSTNSSPMSLLSPVYGPNSSNYTPNLSYVAYAITSLGSMPASSMNYETKPVVYLDPKVKIKSGDGSKGDPYVFELGESKNTSTNYGLSISASEEEEEEETFVEETETQDYEKLVVEGRSILGFNYNAETSTFTNQNKGVPDSMSVAYATFDLTNAETDKKMNISYTLSYSGTAYAYINLLKGTYKAINYDDYNSYNGYNDDDNTSILSQSSVNVENKQLEEIVLEKGYKYYLQFAYNKKNANAVSSTNRDEFSIKVNFEEPAETVTSYTRYDGITPILNQDVDTVEMLRDISLTTALTIEDTRDMILDLNGHTLTTTQNTYTITNNGSLKVIDSKYSDEIQDLTDDQSEVMAAYNQEVDTAEAAAESEYNALSKDDYVTDGMKLALSAKDRGSEEGKWKDLSNNENDFTISNATFDSEDGALVFDDENDYASADITVPETRTLEITFSANADEYSTLLSTIGIGESISVPRTCTYAELSTGTNCGTLSVTAQTANKKTTTTTTRTEKNMVYTVQIVTNASTYETVVYVNNSRYRYSSSSSNAASGISKLLLGRLSEDAESTFKGKIYSIRMYNRILTGDERQLNYRIDQKLYNTSSSEDLTYKSEDLIKNGISYEVKDFSGSETTDTEEGYATTSQSGIYYNGSYVPSISFTNSTAGTNNSTFITDIINFDTTYRTLQFEYIYRVYNVNYPIDIYIGLTKQKNFASIEDFDVYEKITANNSSNITKSVLLKPTEPGKYRLKIVYIRKNASTYSRVYSGSIYNMILNKGQPVDLETRISTELNQTGEINSTTSSAILNNEGANLEIEEGIINLKKAGTSSTNPLYAIVNKGTLTLGKRSSVDATSFNYGVGVLNDTTGDMLDGEATIRGSLYSFHNRSALDTEIKGYTFKTKPFYNESQNTMKLDNVLITDYSANVAIIDNSTRKLSINNSVITATSDYKYVLKPSVKGGIVEINNSEINAYNNSYSAISQGDDTDPGYYSWTSDSYSPYKTYTINNSTINGTLFSNSYPGTYNVNKSTIYAIKPVSGNINLDEVTIKTSGMYSYYAHITINNSTINGTIYNGYSAKNSSASINIMGNSTIDSLKNYSSANITASTITGTINNYRYTSYPTGRNSSSTSSTQSSMSINNAVVKNGTITNSSRLTINGITMTNTDASNTSTAIYNNIEYERVGSYYFNPYATITGTVNISGYKNGIYAQGDRALTIGTNDDTVSQTSIKINAKNYGILNYATFNWYDGSITASVENSILSKIGGHPTDYDIEITKNEDNTETATLVPIDEKRPVAKIGQAQYKSLDEAFDALPEDGTETKIELIDDISTYLSSELDENRNAKIDFANHTITHYNGYITNNGTLKFYDDTSEVTRLNKTFSPNTMLINNGTFDYNDVIFEATLTNTGTMNINSGTLIKYASNASAYSGFISTLINSGDLTINGGNLTNTYIDSSSTTESSITINNVTSTDTNFANKGTMNVLGGTYKMSTKINALFQTLVGSTTSITDGTYDSTIASLISNEGTTTIEGITSTSRTIGTSTGVLTLTNNTFSSLSSGTSANALNSSGVTTFNSGSYSSSNNIISATGGKLTINGTEFDSTGTGITTSGTTQLVINDIDLDTTGTGITIESSSPSTILHGKIKSGNTGVMNTVNGTGTITIGIKGFNDEEETELVSKTDPDISGTYYGFTNGREATVVNFYDGVFKGANPINSNINDVEEGYEVVGNLSNTEKYLGKLPVIRNTTQGIDYYDIQLAISESQTGDNLEFLREVTGLTTTPTYTVSAEKNLTIDLNGKKIIQNNALFLENEGTLKLTNSDYDVTISDTYQTTASGEGLLYNTGKTQMISNNGGDLTLEKILISDATEGNMIVNSNGTLTVNKAIIEDLTSGVAIINDGGTATLNTVIISSDDSTVNQTVGQNITNTGTMTITKGIFSSKKGVTITSSGSNATLDMTNIKASTTKGNIIENTGGTLTIDNAALTSLSDKNKIAINNTGTATIDNATISVDEAGVLNNTGTATIDHATMTSSDNYTMISNTNNLTIKNSTIRENTYISTCFPDKDNNLITSSNKLTLIDTDITRTNASWYSSTSCWRRTYYVFDEDMRDSGQLIGSTDTNLSIKGGTFTAPGNVFVKSARAGAVINIEDATVSSHGGLYMTNGSTGSTYDVTLTNNTMTNVNYSIFASSGSYKPYSPDRTQANIKINGGTYSSTGKYTVKTFSAYYAGERDKFESYGTAVILLGNGANLTIEDATISKPTYTGSESIHSTLGTLTLKSGSILGEVSKYSGTFVVESGTVESITGYKQGTSNEPTISVITGSVTNSISTTGTVRLGKQGYNDAEETELVSISNPSVGGNVTAGSLYFYDGIIKGYLPSIAISRQAGYNIKNTSSGHYLTKDPFIKNTTTNTEYTDLNTAFSEVQDGETLQLIDNQEVYENTGTTPTIPSTSTVTLDLNGKTLNVKTSTFINEGTLNVTGTGKFNISSTSNYITNNGTVNLNGGETQVKNSGTLTINGGTLLNGTNTGTTTLTTGKINSLTNTGTLTITGGTATFTNNSGGTATINGGTIASFVNNTGGSITVNDGTFSGTGTHTNQTGGTMLIKDGTLKTTIVNVGTLTIEKMTVDSTSSMFTNTGTLVADDLTGTASSIGSNNNGTMTLNNSNLTLTTGVTVSSNTAEVTLNNGTYNATGEFINATNGTVNLNGATVTTGDYLANVSKGIVNVNTGNYTTTGNIGFVVNNQSGVINIGNKDASVSVANPVIKAAQYAIYQTSGNINFYDGKLIGNTAPAYGKINEYEPGYKMSISHPDETYIGTLTPIGDDERVAVLNGINFVDLQQAINAARDNTEQNIVLYANITLNDNVVVPAAKIINVYLNGHTLNQGDYTITNNGVFELKEGTPSGLGASIVEAVRDALHISDNTVNVIVYEMEDGTQLSAENTYKLYKKADSEYQVMKMERSEEIGRYVIGNDDIDMTTVRGRLYIENLEHGEYKVRDNQGKEISFTIDSDGKVTGNVIKNLKSESNENLISTAIAELIITIQTGINKINYIALIVILSGIVTVLYLINNKKRFE